MQIVKSNNVSFTRTRTAEGTFFNIVLKLQKCQKLIVVCSHYRHFWILLNALLNNINHNISSHENALKLSFNRSFNIEIYLCRIRSTVVDSKFLKIASSKIYKTCRSRLCKLRPNIENTVYINTPNHFFPLVKDDIMWAMRETKSFSFSQNFSLLRKSFGICLFIANFIRSQKISE